MSLRIVSGERKGKRLKSVPGLLARPTSDRVREAVFNILQNNVADSYALDLFCGTGAMGVEALSRGARWAGFVDMENDCLKVTRQNIASCGFVEKARVIRWDIRKNLDCLSGLPFSIDLVFMDPPYRHGLIKTALTHLQEAGCLSNGAVLVAESAREESIPEGSTGFQVMDQRYYGKTLVTFLKHMV